MKRSRCHARRNEEKGEEEEKGEGGERGRERQITHPRGGERKGEKKEISIKTFPYLVKRRRDWEKKSFILHYLFIFFA